MPHARRHPAPPHLARFAAAQRSHPFLEVQGLPRRAGNTAASRDQRGSRRTPEGTRPRPIDNVLPLHHQRILGLPQVLESSTTTSQHSEAHDARPKAHAPAPPHTFSRRTTHHPRVVGVLEAKEQQQHSNIPRSTRLTTHARRHTPPPHLARSAATPPPPSGSTATPTPQAHVPVRGIVIGAWACRI